MVQFLILFPLLIFLSFFVLYIPGSLLINSFIKSRIGLIFSFITGLAMWGMQAWFFRLFNLEILSYFYIFITCILWFKIYGNNIKKINIKTIIELIRNEKFVIATLILGIIIQLPAAWFFGITTSNGMSLTSNMSSDLQWQASLIYQLTQSIPPNEPGMFNVPVNNYHYFGNLIIAEFIKIFSLPLITVTFQYFSIILSLFLGLSAIGFSRVYRLGRSIELLLLLLLYFGGDLLPYFMLLLGHGLNFEMSALESGADLLTNYPRAFSVIFVFAILALFKMWHEKRNIIVDITIAILIAAAISSKINTGIFILPGLTIITLYFLINKKISHSIPLFLSIIITSLIYIPINKNAGGLIFTGFWRSQDFIVQPSLGLSNLELARQVYAKNNNILKDLIYNFLFTFLYIITIFGSKIISFFQTKDTFKLLPIYLHIFLIMGILMCFSLGMFFIQTSGGANSFNFISTVFILSSIYAAIGAHSIITFPKQKFIRILILTIFLILTGTRSIYVATKLINIHLSHSYFMPVNELKVYTYIKNNIPSGEVFLTGDYPLSFLGNKNIYFPQGFSKGVLSSHGINTKEREDMLIKILTEKNPSLQLQMIRKLKINYAYIPQGNESSIGISSQNYSILYNEEGQRVIKFKN